MKTLTEISGSVIRTAAAAIAQAKRSLPRDEKPADSAVAALVPQPAEGAVADVPGEAAAVAAPSAPPAPPAVAPGSEREVESEAVKAILDEAVATATGYSGDRLAMLRAAVHAVGRRVEDVRLVRVFGLDEELTGAQAIGQHQYVIDFFPPTMKQLAGTGKDERDRGGRRGGGRGGGGARGAKGSTSGGFSMDSLREDRRNERGGGGRPRGGGRAGGGIGAGGGRPGAPPGGDPKK